MKKCRYDLWEEQKMSIKPIKQIKEVQAKTLNFVLSAIIIAIGINFIVSGIISYIDNKGDWIYIVVGGIMVVITVFLLCMIELLQAKSKTIIECVVTYDEEAKELIRIPGYDFSENLKRYLDAACNESKAIKSLWAEDYLGLSGIINTGKGNTKVVLTQSAALLNQLIEYLLLKELSLITVDYFNKPNFNKKRINEIREIDVPDLVTGNIFLELFAKPTSEREAFGNKEEPNVVMAYAPNGALFERFELNLPNKCRIFKSSSNVIELKHPLFALKLTPVFTGFGEVLPHNFVRHYLHNSIHRVQSYKAMIGVELKLSWKALFIRKSKYFEWIDKYIWHLVTHNSFQYFIDTVHWDMVETIIECNSKGSNKIG